MENFRKECDEWLNPLRYTLHFSNASKTILLYTNTESEIANDYPAIKCYLMLNGEKKCELSDNAAFKMYLTLSSGPIAFKHPDIITYIKVFQHYTSLAYRYLPF